MTVLFEHWKQLAVATVVAVAAVGVPVASAAASPSAAASAGTTSRGCDVQNPLPRYARGFTYHVPDDATSKPLPLILAFHGAKSDAADIEKYSGLDAAEAVVVYPQGSPYTDEKTGTTVLGWSPNTNLPHAGPDLDFTRSLVNSFENSFCIDTSRVYATGKSEGAGFAHELACQPPGDRFVDAIAPVAGAFYRPDHDGVSDCSQAEPLPVLEIHGDQDHVIDYLGTTRTEPILAQGGSEDPGWINGWVDRNGCAPHFLPTSHETGEVIHYEWGGCSAGGRVEHYDVLDGDHTWPGAVHHSGPGSVDRQLCASKKILDFFDVKSTVPTATLCKLDPGADLT